MTKFKVLTVLTLGAIATLFAGCSSTDLLKHPSTTHIVDAKLSVKKLGAVQDPVSGQYSLGYQSGFVGLTTIPITTAMDTNGTIHFIVPDATISYEVGGKSGIFGSGGSTYTLAVGQNAVQTLLGGQHFPINGGFYSTNNVVVQPVMATVTSPVPTVPPIKP